MSEQTITEKFSEKPRRGRPPLHPPGYLEDLRRLHLVEQNSIRGQQDQLYQYDAQGVLWPKGEERETRLERFRWLYDHLDRDDVAELLALADQGAQHAEH